MSFPASTSTTLCCRAGFSYLDTQVTLGTANFHQIPINAPKCPFQNFQRDGMMQTQVFKGRANYEPNSLDEAGEDGGPRESPQAGFISAGQTAMEILPSSCGFVRSGSPITTARPGSSTVRKHRSSKRTSRRRWCSSFRRSYSSTCARASLTCAMSTKSSPAGCQRSAMTPPRQLQQPRRLTWISPALPSSAR